MKRDKIEIVADQAKLAILALKSCKCDCCKSLLRKTYKRMKYIVIGKP